MTPPELAIDNPAFVLKNKDIMGLEAEIQIGHRADKMGTSAVLTFRTNNISGYDMNIMVQGMHGSSWQSGQIGAVSIEIVGDYEREILIAFLQKVGLLTVPVFGKYDCGPFESGEE
jgi:hypothetical protein